MKSGWKIHIAAFFIPLFITAAVFAMAGLYPFGQGSLMTGDIDRQFVDFFDYFKSIFTTNNDFIYTFGKNLGGDMAGLSAYYLQNPLLFILFLFPGDRIAAGVEVIFALQVALAGLSCSFMLNSIYGRSWGSLLFSTAYACCGFFFGFIPLVIYFSNLALLPLVLLMFHRMLSDRKTVYIPFILILSLYLFMNYYLGYMLVIFLCLCFISRVIEEPSIFKKRAAAFAVSTGLAIALDGADLLVTALSLKGEKAVSDADFSLYGRFFLPGIFAKFYSGTDRNDQQPLIYCSLAAVIFMIMFFASRRYTMREKTAVIFMAASLVLSMYVNTIDAVWHGFNNPVGFPYRYAYFLSLTVITAGYRGFLAFYSDSGRRRTAVLAAVPVIFIFYTVFLRLTGNVYVDLKTALINSGLVFLLCAAVYISSHDRYRKPALLAVMIISACDMAYSSYTAYTSLNDVPALAEFTEGYDSTKNAVDDVKAYDSSFYRIEKDFFRSPNDPMQFGYAGLSHSSSCEKAAVRHFLAKMGFRDTGLYAFYKEGSTSFADAFLGVRYFISRFDGVYKPYDHLMDSGKYHIYSNPYAMGMAFAASSAVTGTDMNEPDLFSLQNKMASAASGKAEKIYSEAEFTGPSAEGTSEADEDGIDIYTGADDGSGNYGDVVYKIKITEDRPLYMFFDAPGNQNAEIFVNGTSHERYFSETNWSILYAGTFNKGDTVTVSIRLHQDTIKLTGAYFYYEDSDALASWYEDMKEGTADVKEVTSSHLKADVAIPSDGEVLLFTIPYEKAWNIKVDGKKAYAVRAYGSLLAINLDKGEHSIDMQYIPEGTAAGMLISLSALIVTVLIGIKDKRAGRLTHV